MTFGRWVQTAWATRFKARYVHLVFGARQTGKSTLLRSLLPDAALWLDLSQPGRRAEYLRDPDRFIGECRALARSRRPAIVVVDEAQNVPAIFDAVQHLYDGDRARWRFVLCGSSTRKLRVTGANLLPGRAMLHSLYPLVVAERPLAERGGGVDDRSSPLRLPARTRLVPFPAADLFERMTFGELPVVAVARAADRADLLQAYSLVYLEEELRREALVKDWVAFARFLRLAALESGQMVNYARVAKDAGVALPTVKSYYQLLEDMLIGFRVTAFSGSPRKSVLSTERFYLFDLGVRHAAAELPLTPAAVRANPGPIFEQWVGIELWKRLRYLGRGRLHYLRTKGGAEIDFIVERNRRLTPIEVKWTDRPSRLDARHLLAFLDEHRDRAARGYLICRCARPLELHPRVLALPWHAL
jgi:predicted AAA+ superfamily ATPase